jgi:hypothetical protein
LSQWQFSFDVRRIMKRHRKSGLSLRYSVHFAIIASIFAFAQLQAATLAGYWTFNNSSNLGQATVGNNLSIVGTAPTYSATLTDGFSQSLSGVITTTTGTANRLVATHGIAPNPTYVINYTFVMDIFSPAASRSQWRSIFQTNQGNTNDADYFIRNNNDQLGVSGIGYSTGSINEGKWTRLAITVDLNLNGGDVKTYLDGSLFYTHPTNQTTNGTYALDPTVLFFADNDNENAPLNVGALAIFSGTMTASEVSALGAVGTAIPETSAALFGGLGMLYLLRRRRA